MAAETWNFDRSHSNLGFWVRHLMVSRVRGSFASWTGTLVVDDADPSQSKVTAEIDAASIESKDEKRDGHLKGADFLDVEKHPKITFASTKVEKAGPELYRVRGDLTIRGVTKPVVLDVEYNGRSKDPWGGERAGFSAKTELDRKDFGLAWNMVLETGGVLVGDKINVEIELEVIKATASSTKAA